MQRVELPDIDPTSLAAAVDAGSYGRGAAYAAQRAVAQMRWEPSQHALQGLVRGSGGGFYTTIAYLSQAYGHSLEFDHGVCSCPVGVDCKHVVALVLMAAGRASPGVATRPSPPAWQTSLDSLLEARPADPPQGVLTPLAIELTLSPGVRRPATRWQPASEPVPTLTARLVQPGKNGGWVAGSLRWSQLHLLSYYGNYRAEQVQLLQEIYAIYRSGVNLTGYYSSGDEKSIDILAFESARLWPLLDEAYAVGLRLVRRRKLGEVGKYYLAELCLDVTSTQSPGAQSPGAQPAGLVLTPRLRVEGTLTDVVPIRFIGADGHGLVYVDRAEADRGGDCGSWAFRLARLARGVPLHVQRMTLAGQRLEVPAAEQVSFRDGYYPRVRRAITVLSSDGSFEPPAISGPTLVLTASYRGGHHVDLRWDWAYQVGDTTTLVPPDPAAIQALAGYRDIEAERSALASLDQPLESFGLVRSDTADRVLISPVRLSGIDTMRFSTQLLPLLTGQPGVIVEVTGDPVDYREASDSLRIGVSADEVTGDTDWFDLGITITVDGKGVPFADVFVALSQGESHLLLADGTYFSLEKPELQALARCIDEARALQDAPLGELRISRFQAGLWDELTELGVVSHQAAAWQEQVQGLLSLTGIGPGSIDTPAPPAMLRARLRPYQLEGFGWLAFLREHQLGGILADDMGLGKTLQSLALICHAKQANPAGRPFLIVAPTSVAPNWVTEARRFAPDLNVVPICETDARRGQALADIAAAADAIVTSYTLLRLDFESYSAQGWAGLILDEAQFTKNHMSKIYQCARRLPAPFKLAITGTPMENNLMELWSLLSITAPGLFPNPARFRDYYARPIENSGHAELLAQLRHRIRPLVKRRTKEQVATDLPAKQEQVIEVDLHPRHRKLYQTHLQRERQKVLGLIDDINAHRFTIFRSLTLLRQLSLHAGLVDEAHSDLPSSKIDVLIEQLGDVIGGGHRALVFSQFTGFLGKVRERLDAEGVPYCYLDGATRDRAAVVERFTGGSVPVFLISLKAGGFGLNLTEADYCFLLDPWWNPATEAQAVDRTHRIGQTRNVMVYRLIAKDTIEEKVMALKARKAELFTSVLDQGNVFGTAIDADDIRGLFG